MFKPVIEGPTSLGDLKISRKEFYQAIREAKLTGNMPDICFAGVNGASKKCKVEMEEKPVSVQSIQIPGFNFRLSVENETQVNIDLVSDDEVTLSAYPQQDATDDSIFYTIPLIDWRNKIQIGDRIYSGFLIFKKENSNAQSGLILESVVLQPGIVVSIDKKRDPICELRAPKVVSFFDDELSIRKENPVPGFTEQFRLTKPPFAACGANNVVD